jgi:YT521-B-like domain
MPQTIYRTSSPRRMMRCTSLNQGSAEYNTSESKPMTAAGLYLAKSTNSGTVKRYDDIQGMKQMMQPISNSRAVYIPNSSSQHQIVYDPSLVRNEELEKKYTARDIEEMLSDARYFIIKSSNQDNINISRSHGEWATTVINDVGFTSLQENTEGGLSEHEACDFGILSHQELSLPRICKDVFRKWEIYFEHLEEHREHQAGSQLQS